MLSYLRNVREADGSRPDSEPWLEADGEGAIAAVERAHLKFWEVGGGGGFSAALKGTC